MLGIEWLSVLCQPRLTFIQVDELMMIMGLFPTEIDGDQDFGLLSWKVFVPFQQLLQTEPECWCGHDDHTLPAECGYQCEQDDFILLEDKEEES